MRSLCRGIMILGLLVLGPLADAQGVYRWVDENGQVHFTQTPPPERPDAEQVVMRDQQRSGDVDLECCQRVRAYAARAATEMQRGVSILQIYEIFPAETHPEIVEVSNYVAARVGRVSVAEIAGQTQAACMNRRLRACRTDAAATGRRSGTGSGIVIGDELVLTNHHVVDNCGSIHVGDERSPAELLGHDAASDLALLRAPVERPYYPAIRFSRVALGESVVVAGYPLGNVLGSLNVTTGVVSADAGIAGDGGVFQFTAPVQPGSSGGPVLDQSGHLIGVVVARLNDEAALRSSGALPQNVNFAIQPRVLRAFLEQHQIHFRSSSNDNEMSTTAVASEAQRYTTRVACLP